MHVHTAVLLDIVFLKIKAPQCNSVHCEALTLSSTSTVHNIAISGGKNCKKCFTPISLATPKTSNKAHLPSHSFQPHPLFPSPATWWVWCLEQNTCYCWWHCSYSGLFHLCPRESASPLPGGSSSHNRGWPGKQQSLGLSPARRQIDWQIGYEIYDYTM